MSRILIINNLNERGNSINALHFRWSAPSDIALISCNIALKNNLCSKLNHTEVS